MNKKTLIILTAILVAIAVIILGIRFLFGEDGWICSNGAWVKHGNPLSPMPNGNCGTEEGEAENTPETINFAQTGNIIRNDSGEWKLIYEKPGAPALSAGLVFSEKSVCKADNKIVSCESFWNIGDRVKIEGSADAQTGNVKVNQMELIK